MHGSGYVGFELTFDWVSINIINVKISCTKQDTFARDMRKVILLCLNKSDQNNPDFESAGHFSCSQTFAL